MDFLMTHESLRGCPQIWTAYAPPQVQFGSDQKTISPFLYFVDAVTGFHNDYFDYK